GGAHLRGGDHVACIIWRVVNVVYDNLYAHNGMSSITLDAENIITCDQAHVPELTPATAGF
ncbi:MAG: hypothetical protein WBC87_26730, partial [Pseudolabrys sp.]